MNLYRKNPSLILYVLLLVSLPFFSLRNERLGISLSLFFLIIIFFYTFVKIIIIDQKFKKVFGRLDFLLLIYVFYSLVIYLLINNETAAIPIVKTILYFLLYLSLKYFLCSQESEIVNHTTLHGVVIGSSVFFVVAVYALYSQGILGTILNDISYWGFTVKVYGALSSLIVGDVDFESKDIMRSSLGEVFSFYFITTIILVKKIKTKLYILSYIPVNLFYVITAFSRRSLLTASISSFIFLWRGIGNIWLKTVAVTAMLILLYAAVFLLASESRLTDLGDTNNARGSQYTLAYEKIAEKPIFGYGYGAKIKNDYYVHNFIIASAYMMGVVGLIISSLIYFYLLINYLGGIYKPLGKEYAYLLIIPVFGLTVGSTVEGVFTVTSWIIISLYASSLQHGAQGL